MGNLFLEEPWPQNAGSRGHRPGKIILLWDRGELKDVGVIDAVSGTLNDVGLTRGYFKVD